jgi:hypothetical protein
MPTVTSPYPADTTAPLPQPLPRTRADQRRQSRERRKLARREDRLGLRSFETSLSGKTQKLIKRREARYWAPAVGLGGAARGYAYGFAGSREGARDIQSGWIRDKMRKGALDQ